MNLNLDMPVWINLVAALTALGIVLYLSNRQNQYGLRALRGLMASLSGWAFVNGCELAVTDIPVKILLSKLSYVGIVLTVALWLMFALLYRGRMESVRPWHKVLILLPAAGILAAVFTNEWHGTVWPSFTIDPASSGNRLIYGHGPTLYVYTAISYCTIIYATVLLTRTALQERGMHRWQGMLMTAAAIVPLIGNMLYFTGLTPWPSLDTTPILFIVSGLAFAVGILRFRMFDLLPVARDRLFDSLADAVLILDRNGHIADMNATALAWFMPGREWRDWQGLEPHEALAWLPASVVGGPATDEAVALPMDAERWFELRRSDLLGRAGIREGVLLTFRDISRRKRVEMQLQAEKTRAEQEHEIAEAARRAADQANRQKSIFLTNMSHEMRTPLIAITGYLALLEETPLAREQARHAREIGTAADALLGLVNEMLDLSRIEAGRMEFDHAPFRLDTLLEECASMVSIRLLGKPLDLTVEFRTDCVQVCGDRGRVRQMVLNLLGNAAKFTEAGFIRLTLRGAHTREMPAQAGVPEKEGVLWLALDVQDTGPGIAEDQQDRLFEPFTQADRDTARKYGGSGLGLPITRKIAEAMGGCVLLESWPGIGSTFTLVLPLAAEESAAARPDAADHPRERILIVQQGQRTDVAPVGLNALASQPDAPYSNGPDAPYATGRKPTSPAGPDGSLPAGRNAHHMPEANDAKPAVQNGVRPGCRVLLVEDTVANRNLMTMLLEKAGCVVHAATNGLEAVDLFGTTPCDIVLMDIQMPVMDGIEATRFIRTLEHGGTRVPIVALTANAMPGERDACFEAGMDDFLIKPVGPQLLVQTLARWCGTTAG